VKKVTNETESTVSVDERGRMVLPSRLRAKLGIKKGGTFSLRLMNSNKIIIERKVDQDLQIRVKAWTSLALSERRTAGGVDRAKKNRISTKWMSSEYARKKLGL
jgi:AbrB family looped-hinge helix DNA binding protein